MGYEEVEDNSIWECNTSCPHYDEINLCCWQATEKGLCFDVREGDLCRFGYKSIEL